MPVSKTKTVTIAIEVPCYSTREALKCATSLVQCVQDLAAPVRSAARTTQYNVKKVSVS